MAESTNPVVDTVKKAVSGLGARVETAVGEVNKLQNKTIEQADALIESASRATKDQIAFAEEMGSELRKLVLTATRRATSFFQPKA
jgi:capsule polysaccharide export protein KpsE/RkpR